MLSRWTLENFKPIHGPIDLPLRNLTVLAGLNSSGKSSVLQSILLISQTLANQILERPLILNGNIVQLGTFEGIRNHHAASTQVRIGFELSFAERHYYDQPGRGVTSPRYPDLNDAMKMVSASAAFIGTTQQTSETPAIEAVRVTLADAIMSVMSSFSAESLSRMGRRYYNLTEDWIPPATMTAHIHSLGDQEQVAFFRDVKPEFLRLVPYPEGDNYAVEISKNGEVISSAQETLVRLSHFLPNRFVHKFNVEERQRRDVKYALDYIVGGRLPDRVSTRRNMTLVQQIDAREASQNLLTEVKRIVDKANRDGIAPFHGSTVGELLRWARNISLRGGAKNKFVKEIRNAAESCLLVELRSESEEGTAAGLEMLNTGFEIEMLDAATQEVTSFFTGMVRYLGPLRVDPQAAQGFAPSSEPDDVGLRGQYAAAVYDANKKQRIQWWNPSSESVVTSSLEDALDTWVRYIGVAHRVSTREAGLPGVSWMIQHIPGTEDRPLTAVGVGVSQVLPILVAGLLAPIGALMLIEQPELHLHSRAQARLGDFFLGLSLVGKQCIIETHSDCLVNQLRYHVVKGGSAMRDTIAIYFVEQDEAGDARFDPVTISANGNIVNWPDGFFDESLHQEDRITKEAILARSGHARNA